MNKGVNAAIGVVMPLDYLSLYGGVVQRVKADVAALLSSGYRVEMIFPSRIKQPQHDLPSRLTIVTYPNVQGAMFLPERVRLLLDMHTQRFNPFFRSILRKRCGNYSVIFAHSPWSAVAADKAARGETPVIYVAHNFEYGLIKQATRNPLVRQYIWRAENHACQTAAKILCVSEQDMTELQKTYNVPAGKVALLPNTVDVDFFSQTHDLYDKVLERKKLGFPASSFLLLFHGRMDYSANVDALKFILKELVPALRQSSADQIRLMVAGARIPKWCLDSANEIVSFHPDVPDMRRFLSIADAVIVPLSIGGGTRLKILESFAARVPVISTAKGAEGISCQDGDHILIAQRNADDFISKIRILAEKEDLRQRLTTSAYNLVVEKYSIPVAARCLNDTITEAENQAERLPD
jgi:glycosyltransferase involved in cell wall biosynthesis